MKYDVEIKEINGEKTLVIFDYILESYLSEEHDLKELFGILDDDIINTIENFASSGDLELHYYKHGRNNVINIPIIDALDFIKNRD